MLDTLDFAMLDPAPAFSHGHQTEVVAVRHGEPCERHPFGNRLISATVYWRASGEIFLSMETTGGEDITTARKVIANALRGACRSCPPVDGRPATGPQFEVGRTFAKRIARALKAGNASIVNP